jgi:hypothetical protein
MYYPTPDYKGNMAPLPDAKTYIAYDKDGNETEILYHEYCCLGPYSMTGPARGQVTKETDSYWGQKKKEYVVYAEVEESTGAWNTKPKGVK